MVPNQGLVQAYAVGTAALCLSREIIEDTTHDPWFEFSKNSDGTVKPYVGAEDMNFCVKCNAAQIPIYADTDFLCEHLSPVDMLDTISEGDRARADGNSRYSSCLTLGLRQLGIHLPQRASDGSSARDAAD